jgi:hypothetical protein
MTFKAIRCIAPEYVSNMFSHHQNNNYEMRSNMRKLVLGKPKTNFMKRSFSYRGACAWNNLPIDIVNGYEQLSTLIHFKILIDNVFLLIKWLLIMLISNATWVINIVLFNMTYFVNIY